MDFAATHFRKLIHAELKTTEPLNVVLGENRQGKSSLISAMIVALTGKETNLMQRRGESLKSLVTHGADEAILQMKFSSNGFDLDITRRIGSTGGNALSLLAGGKKMSGTPTEVQALICDLFGGAEAMTCALQGSYFLGLDAKQQTGVLSGLLSEDTLDYNRLWKHLETLELSETVGETFSRLMPGSDETGTALLDLCHKTFYDARTEANREVASLKAQVEALLGADALKFTYDLPAIDRELADLRGKLAALQRECGAAEERALRLVELNRELSQCDPDQAKAFADELEEAEKALAHAEETFIKAREKTASLNEKLRMATGEHAWGKSTHQAMFERHEKLLALGNKCNLCGSDLSEQQRAKIVKESETNLLDFVAKTKQYEKKVEEVGEKYKAARDKELAAERLVASYTKEVAEKRAAAEALVRRYEALRQELFDLSKLDQDSDKQQRDADLEETNKAIAETEDLHRRILAKQDLLRKRNSLKLAEEKAAALEELVALFANGPTSVRKDFASTDNEQKLQDLLDEGLKELLPEYEGLLLPDGAKVLRLKLDGFEIPARRLYLSGYEHFALQVIVQRAICKFINLPLLLLDDDVAIDEDNLKALFAFLSKQEDLTVFLTSIYRILPAVDMNAYELTQGGLL